jgi:inward rectifier potassium channel
LAGPNAIEGARTTSEGARFIDDFFFSVQTFSTIGYGKMSPQGILPNLLVTMEALTGMISMAIVAGVLFARFSRPTARVLFSRVALIGMHDGKLTLSMRMANERLNEIVDAEVNASILIDTVTKEGQKFRVPVDLPLERSKSSIFALSWTLFHVIDEKSALYGKTKEDLESVHAEIFLSLVGIDDTFSASIHSRRSYVPSEIVFDHRYADMLHRKEDGHFRLDLQKIHDTVPVSVS